MALNSYQRKYLLAAFSMLLCLGGCGGNSDSNASDSASTAPTPVAGETTSVTLSWDIPLTRENGDSISLSEIDGYEIAYRRLSDELFTLVEIRDPTQSSYELTELELSTYEFKMATYDTDGNVSIYSAAVIADLSGS